MSIFGKDRILKIELKKQVNLELILVLLRRRKEI